MVIVVEGLSRVLRVRRTNGRAHTSSPRLYTPPLRTHRRQIRQKNTVTSIYIYTHTYREISTFRKAEKENNRLAHTNRLLLNSDNCPCNNQRCIGGVVDFRNRSFFTLPEPLPSSTFRLTMTTGSALGFTRVKRKLIKIRSPIRNDTFSIFYRIFVSENYTETRLYSKIDKRVLDEDVLYR